MRKAESYLPSQKTTGFTRGAPFFCIASLSSGNLARSGEDARDNIIAVTSACPQAKGVALHERADRRNFRARPLQMKALGYKTAYPRISIAAAGDP
jgi:hypothetical protein